MRKVKRIMYPYPIGIEKNLCAMKYGIKLNKIIDCTVTTIFEYKKYKLNKECSK